MRLKIQKYLNGNMNKLYVHPAQLSFDIYQLFL